MENKKDIINNLDKKDLDQLGIDSTSKTTTTTTTKKVSKKKTIKKSEKKENNDSLISAKEKLYQSFGEDLDENSNSLTSGLSKTSDTKSIAETIKNLSIDVSSIVLTEKPPIEQFNEMQFIIDSKPTFETVCNESAYIAHVSGLQYKDLSTFENSVGNLYTEKSRLFSTIYSKINTTSLGNLSYEEWLKVTSYYDLPSLEFGIYNETFKSDTKFNIQCKNCGHKFEAVINNRQLMRLENEDVYSSIQKTIASVRTPKEALEKSLVNQVFRKLINNSKIIIDFKVPSLYDYLKQLSAIPPDQLKNYESPLAFILFIKNLYMIDVAALQKEHTVKYYKVTEFKKIAKIIEDLDIEDSQQVSDIISKFLAKYNVKFAIKSFKCPECKKEVGDIDIDMENFLFFQISQL